METCEKCGAPLPEGKSGLCRACARAQAGGAARARTTRTMALVAAALAVVFLGLGTASIILYRNYNPEQFAAQLSAALEASDTDALAGMVAGEDIAVSEEGLLALCRAFSEEEARAALLDQLLAQAVDPTAQGVYPALHVEEDSVFLGYSRYRLKVHSVQLLLTAPAQNPLLTLGDTAPTGEAAAGGVLYKNLFPGSYTCTVTGTSSTGKSVTGAATVLSLFAVDSPTVFDGALPIADITVAGCVSDEAEISVDGVLVGHKPSGGVVTLPQVAVGSTVSLRYTAPHGAVTTASVVFADKAVTALTFENVVTEGGVPAKADIDTLLRGYYASYLDAVNNQDITRVTGVTDAWREQLSAGLATEANKANVFELTDAACEEASVAQRTVGELPGFVCNAAVSWTYTGRESHEESTAGAQLSFEVVFTGGAWAVNRTAACSAEDYAANTVSAFG